MGIIHILDESLINKIAAGEVVERPSSVVKELIENSLDAFATEISVEVKEGGISLIRVSDNGLGMDEEDAKLSLERHATSKISTVQDLFSIHTLGFRGEALSSIVAVAYVTISTRTKDDSEGTFIQAESGKIMQVKKTGCPVGTTVEISDLFFNTPVRKKYLKPISVEFSHILDIITRYALVHPDVFFKLSHNSKIILSSPKTKDLLGNITSIYGKDTAKNLIPVSYSTDYASISGYISKPSFTRNDRTQQSIYVNKRYIKNQIISDALHDAYHSLLFLDRQPIAVLIFEITPDKIDVNVHPSKDVIRVKQEQELHDFVFNAVKQALSTNNLIPDVSIESTQAQATKKYKFESDKQCVLIARDKDLKKIEPVVAQESIGPVLIIGQINKMYILAEDKKGLLIIDQHAAQERILYEQFMDMYEKKGVITQKLLKPKMVEVSPVEFTIIKDNLTLLNELGFETEEYGKNSFIVRTIPFIFERNYAMLIIDVFHELGSKSMDSLKEERIIRFACRAAIKAGDELTKDEMRELIETLDKTKQPYSCPHGRPTMISISLSELERKFKRVG
jgi:DNA mismatch repair protein MutL